MSDYRKVINEIAEFAHTDFEARTLARDTRSPGALTDASFRERNSGNPSR